MSSKFLTYLKALKQEEEISLFEIEFCDFLIRSYPNESETVLRIALLVVNDQLKGNICTDLSLLEDSILADILGLIKNKTEELMNELRSSKIIGGPDDYEMFILEGTKLYLHKYWSYESELVEWLKNKVTKANKDLSEQQLNKLDSLFVDQKDDEINLQKIATALALVKDFVIISGGPGTGKTYTVNKILQALKADNEHLSIALAAPTGKAAERLTESIRTNEFDLAASTLHSLLGARKNQDFRFNKHNKLPFDVVIVDEASMLDLRLWVSLTRSLKESAKLILLGDKDQLASVEAGSILGDICVNADNGFSDSTLDSLSLIDGLPSSSTRNVLNDHIVLLTKSFRAESSSGINEFSKAINDQNIEKVFEVSQSFKNIIINPPNPELLNPLIKDYVQEIVEKAEKTQFLCSNKSGELGTRELNKRIENQIKNKLKVPFAQEWYEGKRILINKNDFSTGLKNGEIGVCFRNEENGFSVKFESAREVSVSQLKEYDLAYAITVHKSQGSEFDNVVIFLPEELNPVLSKELLYTGVTRAKKSTLVVGRREVISEVILKKIKRMSSIPSKILV